MKFLDTVLQKQFEISFCMIVLMLVTNSQFSYI